MRHERQTQGRHGTLAMDELSLAAFSVPALLITNPEHPEIRLNEAAAGTFGVDGTAPEITGSTLDVDTLPAATKESIEPIAACLGEGRNDATGFAICTAPDGNTYEVRMYRVDEPGEPALLALLSPDTGGGENRSLIHDLRNHLNAISINSDVSSILLAEGPSGHEEKIRSAIRRITQNARQAAGKLEGLRGGTARNDDDADDPTQA